MTQMVELIQWADHHNIIGFAYEADVHCVQHAAERFGVDLDDDQTLDSEGNFVHRIFSHESPDADLMDLSSPEYSPTRKTPPAATAQSAFTKASSTDQEDR